MEFTNSKEIEDVEKDLFLFIRDLIMHGDEIMVPLLYHNSVFQKLTVETKKGNWSHFVSLLPVKIKIGYQVPIFLCMLYYTQNVCSKCLGYICFKLRMAIVGNFFSISVSINIFIYEMSLICCRMGLVSICNPSIWVITQCY